MKRHNMKNIEINYDDDIPLDENLIYKKNRWKIVNCYNVKVQDAFLQYRFKNVSKIKSIIQF